MIPFSRATLARSLPTLKTGSAPSVKCSPWSRAPGKRRRFRLREELVSRDATVIELCGSILDGTRPKGAVKLHLTEGAKHGVRTARMLRIRVRPIRQGPEAVVREKRLMLAHFHEQSAPISGTRPPARKNFRGASKSPPRPGRCRRAAGNRDP